MKILLVALLAVVVRGRPQGSPQCGDVTFSCNVDQVLIYDENSSSCACVGRFEAPVVEDQFAPNPDGLVQVNRKRKQVDQPEQPKPEGADQQQKPVTVPHQDQQKPVTLPHQDKPEVDQSKRQSSDDEKKEGDEAEVNKEDSAKRRQGGQDGDKAEGEEKPALAVDPVEVVKPAKPVDRQQDGVVGETRPLPVPEGEGVPVETKPAPVVVEKEKDQSSRRRRQTEVEQAPQVPVQDPSPVPASVAKPADDVRRQSGQEVVAEDPEPADPVEPAASKPVKPAVPSKETGRQNSPSSPFLHRPLVKKPLRPAVKPEVPVPNQDSEVQERQDDGDFDEPTFQLEQVHDGDDEQAAASAVAVQPAVDESPVGDVDVGYHRVPEGHPVLERRRRMDDRKERQEERQDVADEDSKRKRQAPHRAGQLQEQQIEQELQQEGQGGAGEENKRKRNPVRVASDDGQAEGHGDAQQQPEDDQQGAGGDN